MLAFTKLDTLPRHVTTWTRFTPEFEYLILKSPETGGTYFQARFHGLTTYHEIWTSHLFIQSE